MQSSSNGTHFSYLFLLFFAVSANHNSIINIVADNMHVYHQLPSALVITGGVTEIIYRGSYFNLLIIQEIGK